MTAPAHPDRLVTDLSALVAALLIRADHQANCIKGLVHVIDELAERVEILELVQFDRDS
jgi:hypothetical protein